MTATTFAGDSSAIPYGPLSARLTVPQVWGMLLLVPYLLVFLAFVVYPIGYGFWLARHPASYMALYHDPVFARAAVNTLIFLVVGINLKMIVALFLSGFFIQARAWIRWLSVLFILPWAVPSIPTILSLRFMLNPEWGVVNQIIFNFTGDDGPNWLNNPTIALSMAIAVHIWKSLPFWTLILMTGRLAIPQDLFEAAAVDPDIRVVVDAWFGEAIGDVQEGLELAGRFSPETRRLRATMAMTHLDYVERTWTPGHVDADLESTLEVLATSWVALLVSDQG